MIKSYINNLQKEDVIICIMNSKRIIMNKKTMFLDKNDDLIKLMTRYKLVSTRFFYRSFL